MNVSHRLESAIKSTAILGLLFAAQAVIAQGTLSDYQRALSLNKTIANKVFKARVNPHWFGDNARFWYRNDLPDGEREFILVDAERGTRKRAFDHERLAGALDEATGREVQAEKLSIERLTFDESGSTLTFSCENRWWKCDLSSYKIEATTKPDSPDSSLQPLRGPRASRRTGRETSITFINATKSDIEVYWLDSDGQREHYATVAAGNQHRQHTFAGHVWLVTDKDGKTLATFMAGEEAADAIIDADAIRRAANRRDSRDQRQRRRRRTRAQSPDGKWSAFIKNCNLHVRNSETGEETALTEDGTEQDAYTNRLYWSPDSTRLVAVRTLKGDDRKVYLIESSPEDQLQPKLLSYSYLKSGDRIDIDKPHLFDVVAKHHITIPDELFPNPWSISEIRWAPDSSRFTFLYNQRGHQVLRIISVDAKTGEARAIVDEQSETFIDYSGKQFSHYLDQTNEIIWMSERDG
ncbi:MAG: DPP IV N-terminal domain-containing protein, partial [Sedimentisphaerales bacterium]